MYIFGFRFAYESVHHGDADARTRVSGDDEVAFGLDDIVIGDEHDMMDDDDDVFMETTQQLQDQDLYDGIGRNLSRCFPPTCTPSNNYVASKISLMELCGK